MEEDDVEVTCAERYILEFLHETDAILSPKCIAVNIGPPDGYNPSYIGTRRRHLAELGLLERRQKTMYRLTETGREFLANESSEREEG